MVAVTMSRYIHILGLKSSPVFGVLAALSIVSDMDAEPEFEAFLEELELELELELDAS